MKTLSLILAFTTLCAVVNGASIHKRQAESNPVAAADKARRIVRIRGRQREDRQLFFEPLPLAAAAPAPAIVPVAAPAPAILPFATRIVQQPALLPAPQPVELIEVRAQPQPQPIELVEVRAEPEIVEVQQPAEVRSNYNVPAQRVAEVVEVRNNYGAPAATEVVEVRNNYGAPAATEVVEVRNNYGAPAATEVVEVRNNYGAPAATEVVEVRQPAFTVPQTIASAGVVRTKPIAITYSNYNAPGARLGTDAWDYSFESENGIKQEAVGEMKLVGDSEVNVMRGSYEYIGVDNQVYVVEWVADENGFRATAPHLPKSVEIPFPEQRAAVEAQIRFAAEEDAINLRAAASEVKPSYDLPSYSS